MKLSAVVTHDRERVHKVLTKLFELSDDEREHDAVAPDVDHNAHIGESLGVEAQEGTHREFAGAVWNKMKPKLVVALV